jgi:hypothetical protein
MAMDLPAQALVAVGTVVAALIAGVLSFVNLTLTKEQKTSEFRQAWIDALRDDLAKFLSASRACARAIEARAALGERYLTDPFRFGNEKVSELRHEVAVTYYRVKLRLNPDEVEHIELLRLLDQAIDEQNAFFASIAKEGDPFAALDRIADFARPVLKTEWDRVKAGELPFRIVRNWVAPIVVLLCILFVLAVLSGRYVV